MKGNKFRWNLDLQGEIQNSENDNSVDKQMGIFLLISLKFIWIFTAKIMAYIWAIKYDNFALQARQSINRSIQLYIVQFHVNGAILPVSKLNEMS